MSGMNFTIFKNKSGKFTHMCFSLISKIHNRPLIFLKNNLYKYDTLLIEYTSNNEITHYYYD